MVGLRVHARQGGVLKAINTRGLASDPRISEIHLPRRPGHRISLPPEDYDAWLLGHIIFAPDGHSQIEEQCRDLLAKIRVEVESLDKTGQAHVLL